MHGMMQEAESALGLCLMLALVFAGIRSILDPHALMTFASRLSAGIRRFEHTLTQNPWAPERRATGGTPEDRGARRFARMMGLLMTMLGLLGIFEQLSRIG